MSVGSELDVDVQDLVGTFKMRAGKELLNVEPDSYEWADSAADVLADLIRMGWLPPTYTAHVKAKVQEAYAASENDDAFRALRSAADVLGVVLVDPDAAVLESLTPDLLTSLTLGKVA